MSAIKIISTGRYLPPNIVTNSDLSKIVDTNDEWIFTRSGIRSRHYAPEDMPNGEMASKAAKAALDKSGIDPRDITCCIVATFTPDTFTPSISCRVHRDLNLPEDMMCIDLNGACAGFIYALKVAQGLLLQAPGKYALIIGSEKISRVTNFEDRSTCILFGDGAGAVIAGLDETAKSVYVAGTRGNIDVIHCSAHTDKAGKKPGIYMDGSEVFRFATDVCMRTINSLLEQSGLSIHQVDHVVCHQANQRIISHVYKKLKADPAKFFINMESHGNTSAASIPLALADMDQQSLLKKGQTLFMLGFGAGLTWGGTMVTV